MEGKGNKPAVLVVGGGIGGMKAALDMAEMGIHAYLLERRGSLGGAISQLDKWFPTNTCTMCHVLPYFGSKIGLHRFCLRTLFYHPNIEVLPYAILEGLEGSDGAFTATIRSRATFVNQAICIKCGDCLEVCPVEVADEFNCGLTMRKAIYTNPQSPPSMYIIDLENCTRCGQCEKACPVNAIEFNQEDRVFKIEVGAVVLAPGFELFNPWSLTQYGYGRLPNVITSIELERKLSATGPSGGSLFRLSNKGSPPKIAFIQCVGSRDRERPYCSSVCCMYASKEAMLIKRVHPDVQCHIFFMDMRTCGKGYEEYYQRAEREEGIFYHRCRPSAVEEVPGSPYLRIRYEGEDGRLLAGEFDLVVLSVGLGPSAESKKIGEVCGIGLNPYGFSKNGVFSGVESSRSGILVCGAFSAPKDIPETVTEAGEAACLVAETLYQDRERSLSREERKGAVEAEPRLGVFLCACGSSIGGTIDLAGLARDLEDEEGVCWVDVHPFLCHEEGLERIRRAILEGELNRVIIGACSPRLYGNLFSSLLMGAGLEPGFLEIVNLREQCAWVHLKEPGKATIKARDLITAALSKVRLERPSSFHLMAVERKGLVIGGGIAGLRAALSLVYMGFETCLIEREAELGGNLRNIYSTIEGGDPQDLLKKAIAEAEGHPLLKIYRNAELKELHGSAGAFQARVLLKDNGEEVNIGCGAIIVATGAKEYRTTEYLYGEDERVITQRELEELLSRPQTSDPRFQTQVSGLQTVVMVQCVGSRDEERPYCSRICCSHAIKNALRIKELSPKTEVIVLYRDIRTYRFKEEFYKRAREMGVIFIRYEAEERPRVLREGPILKVQVREPLIDVTLEIPADLLVLSTGVVPLDNRELARVLRGDLDRYGFYCEANGKFRPVEFFREGVFLCGLAHSPRLLNESLSQARAAAARAAALLSRGDVNPLPIATDIKERWCAGCGICVTICPFQARELDDEGQVAKVGHALCRGCGACAVACPSGTSWQRGFEKRQVLAMVEAML